VSGTRAGGCLLHCHCVHAQVVPAATKDAVLAALAASGRPFEAVADLCEMAARRDPALARLAAPADLTVIACFPRAVRGLFIAAGSPLPAGVIIHNMREADAATIISAVESGTASSAPTPPASAPTPSAAEASQPPAATSSPALGDRAMEIQVTSTGALP